MSATKINEQDRTDSTEALLRLFPTGATVHTVVRHVSQSSMSRAISVLAIDGDEIRDVSWHVARLGLFRMHTRQAGLKVDGAGMDMTFHVVYTLSQALHGDGYALTSRNL